MTWTAIANSDIDQGSPLTVDLGAALRDRDEGLAAQDTSAPKIADKIIGGIDSFGSPGASVTLTGLDDFSGIMIWGTTHHVSPSGGAVSLSFAVSGSWTGASNSIAVEPEEITPFMFFLDFATGNLFAQGGRGLAFTETIAGASLAIDSVAVGGTGRVAVIAKPQGGQSAS